MKIELTEGRATRVVDAKGLETLADALRALGADLPTACGGRGVCGRCRALIERDGERREVLACQERLTPGAGTLRVLWRARAENVEICRATGVERATDEERSRGFGLAVDLGTTTIECALVSLKTGRTLGRASVRNPQSRYGADVLSRIAAARSERFRRDMASSAGRAIGATASELVARSGGDSRIEEIVVAGNTTMEYLFAGLDPSELGTAPFRVSNRVFREYDSSEFDLGVGRDALSSARVRFFPAFSAFLGGDIVSGYVSLVGRGEFSRGESALFLDAGTNGETLLRRGEKIYGASTAAGPALEGAELSQGSAARAGAIYRVEFDAAREEWRARTLGDGVARCVCGSGLIDALAGMLELGALSPDGRIADARAEGLNNLIRRRLRGSGRDRAFLISEDDGEGDSGVWLTQGDVRKAQLALGAIKAGRRALTSTLGVSSASLDAVYLSGGFGCALNLRNARRVGLLPSGLSDDKARVRGNTSLEGAIDVVAGRLDWEKLSERLDDVETIDLATYPNFNELFAESMRF